MKIKYLKITSNDYPALLKRIADPPSSLYWRGESIEGLMLSVVGSRKATSYGLAVIDKLFSQLRNTGITIVSGLAFGIDAAAHRAALKYNLKTIAVLPCSVDCPRPIANTGLAQDILENGGALVSEYPSGAISHKSNFPKRNRIIAGMSKATLVIEASERSGSLITARLALESNRDVMAVPGSIFSGVSVGTNKLISLGARIITSGDDIKDELGITKDIEKSIIVLDEFESKIVEQIKLGNTNIDVLVDKLSLDSSGLFCLMTKLEIKGIIKRIDNEYIVNI